MDPTLADDPRFRNHAERPMVKGARRGVFFCAVVGGRTYLRFVSADETWAVSTAEDAVVREVGTCLRLIECEPDTPTWYPEALQDRVYDFWEAAQQDIWSDWMRETDPANLQPRVRPLNLRVAEFIRTNPPIDMPDAQVTRSLDILESPWPRREEIMLREWFESKDDGSAELSRILVEQILESGLKPVEPPPLLPPISPEDIELARSRRSASTALEHCARTARLPLIRRIPPVRGLHGCRARQV